MPDSPAYIEFTVQPVGDTESGEVLRSLSLYKGEAEYALYKNSTDKVLTLYAQESTDDRFSVIYNEVSGMVKLYGTGSLTTITCEFAAEVIDEIIKAVNAEVKKVGIKKKKGKLKLNT